MNPSFQGTGLGKRLMARSFQYVREGNPETGLFLWVFEKNRSAVDFYLKYGGRVVMKQVQAAPGGGSVNALKIAWTTIPELAPE